MTTLLEYKGYQAAVSFENDRLVIQVLHVRDHLVAECTDASKVREEFESLIDEYLADCAELGKEPEKPFKGVFNVRVSPDLHRLCAKRAAILDIALNDLVGQALEAFIQPASSHVQKVEWADMLLHTEHMAHIGPVPVFTSREVHITPRSKPKRPEGVGAAIEWHKAVLSRQ